VPGRDDLQAEADVTDDDTGGRRRRLLRNALVGAERHIDARRRRHVAGRPAEELRIVPYIGHGSPARVVVRGRVVDDPEPPEALPGESTWSTARRTMARFATHEVPGAPVRVTLGRASVEVRTDDEGYVDVHLDDPGQVATVRGWAEATIELAEPFRGRTPGPDLTVGAPVRMTGPGDDVGVISDIDDTVLVTGAQRLGDMLRTTVTGSALTRTPFAGVAELYRAVAEPDRARPRPVFYISASPWNLHGFLTAFLRHREIPLGPLLLRDLGIDEITFVSRTQREHKRARIREVMQLHPHLRFVLVGDSGEHDPEVYAETVEDFPGRVLAVWIREVRVESSDRRVEAVAPRFEGAGVPFLLAADSDTAAVSAARLGLLDDAAVARVRAAVAASRTLNPLTGA
jgi:phosphatidate phosphatase APP1